MARKRRSKKTKVNKSLEIRNYAKRNQSATPKKIVAVLAKKGIDVSSQYVSSTLSNMRKEEAERQAAASVSEPATSRPGKVGRPAKNKDSEERFSGEELICVKELVARTGSVSAARKAVDVYAQLIA